MASGTAATSDNLFEPTAIAASVSGGWTDRRVATLMPAVAAVLALLAATWIWRRRMRDAGL